MILGLLSLAVGFDRANPVPCLDQYGNNSPFNDTISDNQDSDICHQGCFGLKTGIRQDPQNPSQYVLNMHRGITINTGLGLSVGCCVPAVLSMASIWLKLVREKLAGLATYLPNWNSDNSVSQSNMAAASTDEIRRNEHITPEEKERHEDKKRDDVIRQGLGLVERVVFSAVIVAIVILGERNFWSVEMRAGVEPMSSVGEFIDIITMFTFFCCVLTTYFSGQWAPILGAVIGALGSWYTSSSDSSTATLPVHQPHDSIGKSTWEHIEHFAGEVSQTSTFSMDELLHPEPAHRLHRHSSSSSHPLASEATEVHSHRTRVNNAVHRLGIWLTPALDRLADDIEKTPGSDRYREYPHTPGEEFKNPHLSEHDRLHRMSVQSFAARSSPPETLGLGEPGPSRHRAPPLTPTGDYLTVPLQQQRSPPHRHLSLPPDGDDTSPPAESVSPVKIVVITPDVEDPA